MMASEETKVPATVAAGSASNLGKPSTSAKVRAASTTASHPLSPLLYLKGMAGLCVCGGGALLGSMIVRRARNSSLAMHEAA